MKQGMLSKVGVHVATTVLPKEKIVHECEWMVTMIQVWRSETAGVGDDKNTTENQKAFSDLFDFNKTF